MFMHIVTQLSGRGMALYIQVLGWLKTQLCKLANSLRVSFSQIFQSAASLLNRLAKTLLNFKVLLVSLITVVQSIKVELKRVVIISGQIGQQLVTTVRQIRQHVVQLFKKDK
jgi:hypothetical protein